MSSLVDPKHLLNNLEPILDLYGGLKSVQTANRFVNVMREAGKLVHRCVYLNIIRSTSNEDIRKAILNLGGWNILHDWLKEAEREKHWEVVRDLFDLFLELPVSIDLLRSNSTPKLIRHLSKRADLSSDIKNLAADIVLIWKDLIIGETSEIAQNNNNVRYLPSPTKTMKQVDPNIDIEESEDSFTNQQQQQQINRGDQNLVSRQQQQQSQSVVMGIAGNLFEKMMPSNLMNKPSAAATDAFAAAISNVDSNLCDINKRPKTTKSYPSKFRSGFDVDSETPPVKRPKQTLASTSVNKPSAADVIKATAAKRLNDDNAWRVKQSFADKKLKPSSLLPPGASIIETLLPPAEPSTIASTSIVTTPTSTMAPTSSLGIKISRAPPAKAVQLIESNSFMAALEGTAAQKASVVRRKKVVPKSSANMSSSGVGGGANNKNILIAKPQYFKETSKSSTTSDTQSADSTTPPMDYGKKRVRWAKDAELVQVQYFEIDETERINVNRIKAWGDLKHFEMHREREQMEAAKKQRYEEATTEEIYFPWKLIKFDGLGDMVEYGTASEEKKIQFERQKSILAEVFLPGMPLPDTPKEPDLTDRMPLQEPILIPLDDVQQAGPAATQLPPELNKLLEGLKQSGMMSSSGNVMAPGGNMMNVPPMMMQFPPNMMQNMMPPNSIPPMMGGRMMPPNVFAVPPPVAGGVGMPMYGTPVTMSGGQQQNVMMTGPPNGQMQTSQPPPVYAMNMNMGPRNNSWNGPRNQGPMQRNQGPSRPGGPPSSSNPQHFGRAPFRPRGAGPRQPYKNFNKPCPYFQQDRCNFGDQCRYLHIKESRNDGSGINAYDVAPPQHQLSNDLIVAQENSHYDVEASSNFEPPRNSPPKEDVDLKHCSVSTELTPSSPTYD